MLAVSTSPVVSRRLSIVALLAGVSVLARPSAASAQTSSLAPPQVNFAGRLEFEGRSPYSHICIRQMGNLRSMLFVRDSGEEVLESQIDLKKPFDLRFEYLRALFTSYLLRDQQPDVLIVGLGGGGMVHFLSRFDPAVHVDAVEIDPLVVQLADRYFGVRPAANVAIHTADGLQFIAEADKKYDVIYMDAFLKPSADTDATGAPLELRTREFYRQMQSKLKPGGVVAFNINPHDGLADDLHAIQQAFPQTYVFPLSRNQGVVALATTDGARLARSELLQRAKGLQKRLGGVPLVEFVKRLPN
jgi:spermidine synthase